jgi:DHA2 family multidrug resistance protein
VWQGVGFSLLFAALSTAALATVPRQRMTSATGLYNVVRQVMGSIGIALAATTLTHSQATYHAVLVEDMRTPVALRWLAGVAAAAQRAGADLLTAQGQALELLDRLVQQQATVLAYNHIFALVAVIFLLIGPLVPLLPRSAGLEGEARVVLD